MEPGFIIIISVAILLTLIVFEQPVWLALAASGGVGLLLLDGFDVAASSIGTAPYTYAASYSLVVIPMFILMGVFVSRAGLAADLFSIGQKLTSKIPGGLGVATILASGGFAAVSGSSVATVATIGRVAIDEMRIRGYKPNSAAAIVAAGGTLGVLIPPSVLMVVYASLVGESVAQMLLAGIIPGFLSMLVYSIVVVVQYKRGAYKIDTKLEKSVRQAVSAGIKGDDSLYSEGGEVYPSRTKSPDFSSPEDSSRITAAGKNLMGVLYISLLFIIVIGGIYSGIFTATESGGIAAIAALAIMLWRNRGSGSAGALKGVSSAVREGVSLTSMILALVIGGGIFGYFLVKTGVPNQVTRTILESNMSASAVVLVALAIMVVLGFFLDAYSILVITIPLFWPVLSGLGVDGIWFGILAVVAIEIGMLTPPFGINIFVVSSMSKHVTVEGAFRAVLSMVIAQFVVLGILFLLPDIVTWLPEQFLMNQKP